VFGGKCYKQDLFNVHVNIKVYELRKVAFKIYLVNQEKVLAPVKSDFLISTLISQNISIVFAVYNF